MSLLQKLKHDRAEAMETIEELNQRIAPLEASIEDWAQMVADYDIAIAALEPIPEPETQTGEGVKIPEGWTEWNQDGDCPVPIGDTYEWLERSGETYIATHDEEGNPWRWTQNGHQDDLIAYRIIKPAPTPDAEPVEHISILTGDPAIEPESGLHGEPVREPEPERTPADAPLATINDIAWDGAVGFSALNQTWHAVNNGEQMSFTVGSFVNLGHPAWTPARGAWTAETLDDARQMAIDYANSVPPAPESVEPDDDGIEHPQPEWNEDHAPVTNPDAEAQAKALDYYSPEKIAERTKFNPFAVFRREPEGV
ncbi:MAG: hypothetical protein RIR33_3578 [Pseudomonadota bacterium]|jgi:hypothetical protein